MANEVLLGDIGVASPNPRVAVVQSDRSDAAAIEAAGNLGADIVSGVQRGRTKQAARDIGDALNVAHGVKRAGGSFDPDTGEIDLPAARTARENERNAEIQRQAAGVKKRSEDAFRKINRMVAQRGGSLQAGGAMARTLVEREMRNILSLTPGFESEVRQAASTVMGFDPTGGTMEALFNYRDPTVEDAFDPFTDTEVGKNARELQMAGMGVGVELTDQEALRMAGDDYLEAQQVEQLQRRAEMGTFSTGELLNDIYAKDNNSLKGFMKKHAEMVLTSGGTTGYQTEDFLASRDQWVNDKTQQAISILRSGDNIVSQEDEQRIRQHYTNISEPWARMVSAGNWNTIFADKKTTIENLMFKKGIEVAPELMTWSTAFGEGVTTKLLDAMDSVTNEAQYSLLQKRFPTLTAAFGDSRQEFANGFGNAYRQILNGQRVNVTGNPETDKMLEGVVVDEATNTSNPAETNDIFKQLGEKTPKLALSALAKKPQKFYELDQAGKTQFREIATTNMMNLVDQLASVSNQTGRPLEIHGAAAMTDEAQRDAIQRRQEGGIHGFTTGRRFSGETRLAFTNASGAETTFPEANVQALNDVYKRLFGKLGKELTQGRMANDQDTYLNEVKDLVNYRSAMMQRDNLVDQIAIAAEGLNGNVYDESRIQSEQERIDRMTKQVETIEARMVPLRRSTEALRKGLNISFDNE